MEMREVTCLRNTLRKCGRLAASITWLVKYFKVTWAG